MASADLSQELKCLLCLNIDTDSVILRCGHNFCRGCIDRVLDTQEGSGGYSCPECREQFMKRPTLQRNIALRKIAESFLSTQPDQEEAGVFCTYCIHSAVPAVMSCLRCDASLCDNHLRVHSKAPQHVLCDPNTSLENRICSIHKHILEYYCTEDAACICVYCRLDGEHRGHQVEMLDEASEKKKKKMTNDLQKLMAETEEAEKRVQSLEKRRRKAQETADGETEQVTALIRDLRRRLDDLEQRVLSDITRQAQQVSQWYSDVIQQLEIKKEELSRKMRHIEELYDRKTASRADSQNRPETPERFQYSPQVLSSQRFSSGRHYWEVDVGGSDHWSVGMCYPTVDRRGGKFDVGSNNKSWCLEMWGNKYSVKHGKDTIQLPDKISSKRVRICLDYEAGEISFYALCYPIRHLHTFTAYFIEPLHAGLCFQSGFHSNHFTETPFTKEANALLTAKSEVHHFIIILLNLPSVFDT
ncbi:E3 ubiquitin-protein ligase TRIM39-like [Hyperolius riggenbachi]|uniref:E3 ubiquitin-protein ligase TRIM39-like n=1 Tax=Hyperolius riggenbachi TaxID=752182 RepID=UPI0035A37F4F